MEDHVRWIRAPAKEQRRVGKAEKMIHKQQKRSPAKINLGKNHRKDSDIEELCVGDPIYVAPTHNRVYPVKIRRLNFTIKAQVGDR